MRTFLQRLAIAVLAVVVLAAAALAIVWAGSGTVLAAKISPGPAWTGDASQGSAERGAHLAQAAGSCMDCHRATLGGGVFVDDPAFGHIYASNLTRGSGGAAATYSEADFERAIRRGIRPDGTRLLVMPSWSYAGFSDADVASLIAFVRSLPPVDATYARPQLGPVGAVLVATHKLRFDADRIASEPVPARTGDAPAPTAAHGMYLARTAGCFECHGTDLAGGKYEGPPDAPPAQNITPAGIGTWSQADFVTAMRTGKRPDGSGINPFMPWNAFAKMTDDELSALWQFLRTVPAKS